jgi:hypothetical protein
MDIKTRGFPSGRLLLILILLASFAVLAARIARRGWISGWEDHVGVHAMAPPFLDLRAVLLGLDRYRAGTPIAEIQQRATSPEYLYVAYPSLWIWMFAPTSLGQTNTIPLGIILGAISTVVAVMFLSPRSPAEGIFDALLLISPCFMLGIERGNVDLLVFLITIFGLWLLSFRTQKAAIYAAPWLMLAAALKLYPIAAIVVLVRKRYGWLLVLLCGTLFAGYCVVSLDDLRRIWANAGRDTNWSFGCMVFFDRAYQLTLQHGWPLNQRAFELIGLGAALITLIVVGLTSWHRVEAPVENNLTGMAFLAGASIYVFCFLTGNHYAYRLRWVILAVPQLFLWIRQAGPARRRAIIAAATVLLASYITNFSHFDGPFFISELINWTLFAVLSSLLFSAIKLDAQHSISRLQTYFAAGRYQAAHRGL